VIEPTATVDLEASKLVELSTVPYVALNAATGAWSEVIAIPSGKRPTVIAVPAVFVATVIGVTVAEPLFAT
jgi:hypothetical protein